MKSLFTKSLIMSGLVVAITAASFAQHTTPAAPPAAAPAAPTKGTPPAATAPAASQPAVKKDLPAAKDIVKAGIDAMGGKKGFDDLESMSVKATMTTPMGDMKMDMTSAKPGKFVLKQSSPMGEAAAGRDGTQAWKNIAMAGGYSLMEPEEAKQAQQQANMFRMVLNLEEDFKTMETVDKTDFNGEPSYKIHMTGAEGNEQVAYFSVDKKLIQGIEIIPPGAEGPAATLSFSEWKDKGALKVYTKMNIEQMGQAMTLNFTEVEFNKVDPKTFDLPAEVKELLKKKDTPATAPAATKPATPPAPPAGSKPAGSGH